MAKKDAAVYWLIGAWCYHDGMPQWWLPTSKLIRRGWYDTMREGKEALRADDDGPYASASVQERIEESVQPLREAAQQQMPRELAMWLRDYIEGSIPLQRDPYTLGQMYLLLAHLDKLSK
jgi:hypothetical protein